MNSDEFIKLIYSEVKEVRADLQEVKKEMTTLKVKVALFSSVIGGAFSFIVNKFL